MIESLERDDASSSSPGHAAAPLLLAERLSRRFADKLALSNLDLELHPGEVIGLVGPNGAGKTTTLKLLLGMLRPSQGRAQILGFDCTRETLEVKQCVGYTPDEPQFYDFLTGRETLQLAMEIRNLDRDESWHMLRTYGSGLDVGAWLDEYTGAYSLGMRKKLALLCALLHKPTVLLLDEPINGLDLPVAQFVRRLLRTHANEGGGVLISTHLLDMATQICDRLLVMSRGSTLGFGSADELKVQAGVGVGASFEQAFFSLVHR